MSIEYWALGYSLPELSCWSIDADDDSAVDGSAIDDNADEVKDVGDDDLQHEHDQCAMSIPVPDYGLWVLILADEADGSDENIDKD